MGTDLPTSRRNHGENNGILPPSVLTSWLNSTASWTQHAPLRARPVFPVNCELCVEQTEVQTLVLWNIQATLPSGTDHFSRNLTDTKDFTFYVISLQGPLRLRWKLGCSPVQMMVTAECQGAGLSEPEPYRATKYAGKIRGFYNESKMHIHLRWGLIKSESTSVWPLWNQNQVNTRVALYKKFLELFWMSHSMVFRLWYLFIR